MQSGPPLGATSGSKKLWVTLRKSRFGVSGATLCTESCQEAPRRRHWTPKGSEHCKTTTQILTTCVNKLLRNPQASILHSGPPGVAKRIQYAYWNPGATGKISMEVPNMRASHEYTRAPDMRAAPWPPNPTPRDSLSRSRGFVRSIYTDNIV